ncbi:FtsB family cell division protein [Faecalibacter rhinopitheci]|uniref:Septum formation initiator family protein n=1 Tax=Faecalibacter rhinopitheci TaxID=2779678 RepID=A0A8J7G3Z4_9FLAO|nr:septum formation initiator family protein [Faecalibacter rhinopitheci]MBF0596222.1 septum formation initiator family protein [Faecalibacter rhinopitheci]MBQ0148323.1 septum formation initiator family protein [Candidatus Onthonaster equi]
MSTFIEKLASSKKYSKFVPYVKWFGYFVNRYTVVSVCFIIWMIFFDQNSFITHQELDKQIRNLEMDEAYFRKNLENENEKLKMLIDNPAEIERIAREKFFLKKDNEDIFIIQEEPQKKPQKTTDE